MATVATSFTLGEAEDISFFQVGNQTWIHFKIQCEIALEPEPKKNFWQRLFT